MATIHGPGMHSPTFVGERDDMDGTVSRRVASARDLRQRQTSAEAALWSRLRRQQLGVTFRRQHVIGPFVVDFCCLTARLIVELDGSIHDLENMREQDAWRTKYLEERGFTVIRFTNDDVLTQSEAVIAAIRRHLI